jgi:alkylation response protein AidB-like acyl-CoA dehydrogenase
MRDHELSVRQIELVERVRALGQRWVPQVQQWDRDDSSPLPELLADARDAGLLGITVPARHGGQDRDIIDYVLCIEEMCRVTHSWLTAEALFRTSGPGPTIIMAAHDDACREKFLPDIVDGRKTCAIALTEPDHGSGLTDLETTAVEDGDCYVVNGVKRFVTGAPEDNLYATFMRFGDIPGAKGIGAMIVEKGTEGLELIEGSEVMGARGTPHGKMIFSDCPVPKENLVLGPGHFSTLMKAFNVERMHNAALSVGLAQGALDMAIDYARRRKQFGRPIFEFQAVYHSIAEMHMETEAARQLVYRAALTATDGKFPLPLEVSVAKTVANRAGRNVCWRAMQIHGGDGLTKDYLVEQSYRDVIAASYGGGTADISKNVIASLLLGEKLEQRRYVPDRVPA